VLQKTKDERRFALSPPLDAYIAAALCVCCGSRSLELNADVDDEESDALNQLVRQFRKWKRKRFRRRADATRSWKRSSAPRSSSSARRRVACSSSSIQRRVDDTQHSSIATHLLAAATIPALAAAAAVADDEANGAWRPTTEASDREQ